MSAPFSLPNFLRVVPNQLLKQYFERKQLLQDQIWYFGEREIEAIHAALQALPEPVRDAIDKDFLYIHELACPDGIRALIEEGQFHGLDLAREFEGRRGAQHKAMWAFLNHPAVFDVATLIHFVDSLPSPSWVRRNDLPRKPPNTGAEASEALGRALSDFYYQTQGRGRRCTIETYRRGGRQHYFFAYLDDYADIYVGYGADDRLVRRAHKRAFEVVFVYDPQHGMLDLFAKGGRPVTDPLLRLFGMLILGVQVDPDRTRRDPYYLDGLLSRDVRFPTDPADGVLEVRVRKLRLSQVGQAWRRITFEANPYGPPDDVYRLMDEFLTKDVLWQLAFQVTQAMLQVSFVPGSGRDKPLVINLTHPNRCDLHSKPEDLRRLGEKLLRAWGIARA